MADEDQLPPKTKEDARARRMRPSQDQYDPDTLSHWSIVMTIAWIVHRNSEAVRKHWDAYREKCADWIFIGDFEARSEVQRIAINNLISGKVAKRKTKLDKQLKQGTWQLVCWKQSSWIDLHFSSLGASDADLKKGISELWRAAGEGKTVATAINCSNEHDFDGALVEIPGHLWSRLIRGEDKSGRPILRTFHQIYRDVQFARLDVKQLWPENHSEDAELGDDRSKSGRGKKKGQGSYDNVDAPLLEEMAMILSNRKAASPEEAAKRVADRAHGAGTFESKVERLAKRFRKKASPNSLDKTAWQ